ncbi:hypothetical protein [Sorangium atrum]|uniref:Lipoprotein n=1 Tax=Sorangium atrum TaxID=2995308 RepID=A0ABT5CHX7_9BACT|nr:hypothetical protein [Sorangium aterium]MDC0685420.1 hypothetical protein [Sorangium aterium]
MWMRVVAAMSMAGCASSGQTYAYVIESTDAGLVVEAKGIFFATEKDTIAKAHERAREACPEGYTVLSSNEGMGMRTERGIVFRLRFRCGREPVARPVDPPWFCGRQSQECFSSSDGCQLRLRERCESLPLDCHDSCASQDVAACYDVSDLSSGVRVATRCSSDLGVCQSRKFDELNHGTTLARVSECTERR